jgi:hypothetical protein
MHASFEPLPVVAVATLLQLPFNNPAEIVTTAPALLVVKPITDVYVAIGPSLGAAAVTQPVQKLPRVPALDVTLFQCRKLAGVQRAVGEQTDTVAVGNVAEGK